MVYLLPFVLGVVIGVFVSFKIINSYFKRLTQEQFLRKFTKKLEESGAKNVNLQIDTDSKQFLLSFNII